MKKKNIQCQICKETLITTYGGFARHLRKHKITSKEYYDKYLKKPEEGLCKICGKETRFGRFAKGYKDFCSHKCVGESDVVKEKRVSTCLKKYGVKNYTNKEKSKKTCLERYGVEFPLQSNKIFNKTKHTCLERYGVENPFSDINIQKKMKNTMLKRYGVEHALKNNSLLQKSKKTCLERYGVDHVSLITSDKNKDKYTKLLNDFNYELIDYTSRRSPFVKLMCPENHLFDIQLQFINKRIESNEIICIKCNPIYKNFSNTEKQLSKFIKDNYSGNVIENSREIISPLELDIYLPELNLAFEFNGLYWHNELNKPNDYHLNKTEECESKGIHLIHIYEDDWNYKQDIVKSRILNLLGKSERIYARKCIVKEISPKYSKELLIQNHIQGNVPSKFKLGLYHNNELVSIMTFGGLRKNLGCSAKHNHYELLRFCNKLNTTVVGGANKLFKHFLKQCNPEKVISYADRSWSQGNLYYQLNFQLQSKTKSNYHYIVNNIRENRFKYRKDQLVKQGYNPNQTEHEIMMEREIFRIYDSGHLKFVFNN